MFLTCSCQLIFLVTSVFPHVLAEKDAVHSKYTIFCGLKSLEFKWLLKQSEEGKFVTDDEKLKQALKQTKAFKDDKKLKEAARELALCSKLIRKPRIYSSLFAAIHTSEVCT